MSNQLTFNPVNTVNVHNPEFLTKFGVLEHKMTTIENIIGQIQDQVNFLMTRYGSAENHNNNVVQDISSSSAGESTHEKREALAYDGKK